MRHSVQAGKHKSSESTDSAEEDDSSPPPRPKSRRLPVQANISAQGSIRRKRQAQLDEVEDRYASEGQEEIETLHNGSLVSVVANAAVAADGLKKVTKFCRELEIEILLAFHGITPLENNVLGESKVEAEERSLSCGLKDSSQTGCNLHGSAKSLSVFLTCFMQDYLCTWSLSFSA